MNSAANMEMQVSPKLMRQLAKISREHQPTTQLPELKAKRLAWSLMYTREMQAKSPAKESDRISQLSQPREPSYAYPEALQYEASQAFAKMHASSKRSISPRYNVPDYLLREAQTKQGPGAYSPKYEHVDRNPGLAKLCYSNAASQMDQVVRRANKIGPGQYNPYVGEDFERSKRGFSLRGRDSQIAVAECYCDRLGGDEVVQGWKHCEGDAGRIKINQSDRFKTQTFKM